MRRYKVLILTDHSTHTSNNSFYGLVSTLVEDERCQMGFVASRGNVENEPFFNAEIMSDIYATRADKPIAFESNGSFFTKNLQQIKIDQFDLILLRLPRPVSDHFLRKLKSTFSRVPIINDPLGIIVCSNKSFLLNFPSLCPPIQLCRTIEEINDFASQHETVLKPLRDYGGRGLLRISGEIINDGKTDFQKNQYLKTIEKNINDEGYLAMKYLRQVSKGDKRLIVVGGEILAASLRLPPEGSWLCNVALGGTAVNDTPSSEEYAMVEQINPIIAEEGILIYGLDTLVDDDGRRTLSEINALSIGGLSQAQQHTHRPVIQMTINKIFDYADSRY